MKVQIVPFAQTNRTTPNPRTLKEHNETMRLLKKRADEIARELGIH